jgi:hypothetical protein
MKTILPLLTLAFTASALAAPLNVTGYITATENINAATYLYGPVIYGTKNVISGSSAYITSPAYASVVVGQWNKIEGNQSAWVSGSTEPLLVAANGTDTNNRKNAFAVYKDGTVTISKRQGDVGMGRFGNTGDQ